jgi:hypothetical protein
MLSESNSGGLLIALMPGSVVSGRVVASDGSVVAGVPVFMRANTAAVSAFREKPRSRKSAKGTGRGGKRTRSAGKVHWKNTNGRGEYAFRDVQAGDYEIGLGTPSSPVAGPFSILVVDGGEVEQSFQVDAVGEVTVEVREDGGFRIRKALVELRGSTSRATYRQSTDDFGAVRFGNVLKDEYRVTVSRKGFRKATETIKVDHNDRLYETIALERRSG